MWPHAQHREETLRAGHCRRSWALLREVRLVRDRFTGAPRGYLLRGRTRVVSRGRARIWAPLQARRPPSVILLIPEVTNSYT